MALWTYGGDNDGWYVSDDTGTQRGWAMAEADARHLAACVNACGATSTAVLESLFPDGGLPPCVEIRRKAEDHASLLSSLKSLIDSSPKGDNRPELLAARKIFVRCGG